MQSQQLYNEARKLKHELDLKREELEDVREELREMTQMYLIMKQERDKYKFQIGSVRNDLNNIDKIIKDNVEKAVKSKEKQIQDMIQKQNEQQQRLMESENHKKCYLETITYLENLLKKREDELREERQLTQQLVERQQTDSLRQSQITFIKNQQNYESLLEQERAKLKQLKIEDDIIVFDQKVIAKTKKHSDQRMMEKELTTHGDDYEEEITSYDEVTNCRLRGAQDNDLSSALFGNNLNGYRNGPASIVRINEVKIEMKSGSKEEVLTKSRSGHTPSKVMPFDETI